MPIAIRNDKVKLSSEKKTEELANKFLDIINYYVYWLRSVKFILADIYNGNNIIFVIYEIFLFTTV